MPDEPEEREPFYRRRYGVIFRPGMSWSSPPWPWNAPWRRRWVNDGGRDAPMGPRDQALFRDLFWLIVLVIVVIAVLVLVG